MAALLGCGKRCDDGMNEGERAMRGDLRSSGLASRATKLTVL
jgi:hypothetical protein